MSASQQLIEHAGKVGSVRDHASTADNILELRGLTRVFHRKLDLLEKTAKLLGANVRERRLVAVDDVNLVVRRGEVVGLVGESGCGKSTLGRMVAGVLEPSSGTIVYEGHRVGDMTRKQAHDYALQIQMVFQDPLNSLNPRMTIGDIIGEAPLVHGIARMQELGAYVRDILRRVQLNEDAIKQYPHQFSGGQRQRIGIGRALAVAPRLLVCDEAVAALDVSIQAQILNLFMRLREELSLTYLFISHDLGVVRHISDRTVIMYLGRIVESAPTLELFGNPNHPYTRALISEIPDINQRKRRFYALKGEIPSPLSPPGGCHFHPRCPHAMPVCREERPKLREVAPGHMSACHLNA